MYFLFYFMYMCIRNIYSYLVAINLISRLVHKAFIVLCISSSPPIIFFNPFSTNVPLLYPLETSEKRTFSDVFRGYRSGTLVENGLIVRRRLYKSSTFLLGFSMKKVFNLLLKDATNIFVCVLQCSNRLKHIAHFPTRPA